MDAVAVFAELNRRFAIPGVAQIVSGKGGLPKVEITTADALGEIYLHGAHVTFWKPHRHEEVLFVSTKSRWQEGSAIRGGVPICFPWFADRAGDPHAPAHGFVRTKAWKLDSIAQECTAVAVTLSTGSDETTKKWWPADFQLIYRAVFGRELRLELTTRNVDARPLRFEEALHTYYKVGQLEKVRLRGLEATRYIDKTDGRREKTQQGDVVIDSWTDRVYLNTAKELDLVDSSLQRHTLVDKENSFSTVIWNPHAEMAGKLSDLEPHEWTQLFCVETANVGDSAVELAPGQEHTMSATIRIDCM
jgi:glucose-6-phosphate 1-epimerase